MRDLANQRFGRWLAMSPVEVRGKYLFWPCVCSCGTVRSVCSSSLTSGRSRSCGCLQREAAAKTGRKTIRIASAACVTHGHSDGPEYSTWWNMLRRCENPTRPEWVRYGGRGIKVCGRWRTSFANFFTDMGPRPPGMTLDRINNDGNYEPANCRWATNIEQQSNKRTSHRITFRGNVVTIAEAARLSGVHRSTLLRRLRDGWSVERATTTPSMAAVRALIGGER